MREKKRKKESLPVPCVFLIHPRTFDLTHKGVLVRVVRHWEAAALGPTNHREVVDATTSRHRLRKLYLVCSYAGGWIDTGIGPACVGRSVRATTWGVSRDPVVAVGTDGVCASRRVQPVTDLVNPSDGLLKRFSPAYHSLRVTWDKTSMTAAMLEQLECGKDWKKGGLLKDDF